MIEDQATEKLKKRLQDWGLIVNASSDQPEPKNKSEDKQGSTQQVNKKKGRKK